MRMLVSRGQTTIFSAGLVENSMYTLFHIAKMAPQLKLLKTFQEQRQNHETFTEE